MSTSYDIQLTTEKNPQITPKGDCNTPLLVKSNENDDGKASIFSSAVNISNNNIGSGILGLSYAVSESGWFLGIMLFVLFGIQMSFSYNLLMSIGRTLKISSWSLTCNKTIPRYRFKELVDIIVIISAFGPLCSYLIIIGNNMSSVAKYFHLNQFNSFLETKFFWISIFMLLLILPTTLLRKLDPLKYSSTMALICFICLIFIMVFYFLFDLLDDLNDPDDHDIQIDAFAINGFFAFFNAAPIYVFAFGGHKLAFIVTNELKNNTLNRINQTIFSAFLFVTIMYVSVSLCGYFTFGNKSNANILQNYPLNDIPIMIIRICLSIAVAFSYPVVANPYKHSMITLFGYTEDISTLIWYKYYFIVFIVIIITFAVSMLTDDLGIIFKLFGSTSATLLQIILPGLLYCNYDCDEFHKNPLHKIKKKFAMLTVIFGCVMMPIAVTLVFL